jgi:hypothetical protein
MKTIVFIGRQWPRCGAVEFVALRQTRRRAQRQATETFARQKLFAPQSDRCAVSAKSQRDLAHQPHRVFRG